MPELAEVEFFRKEWNAGLGEDVTRIALHPRSRLFRRCDPHALQRHLPGARLEGSDAHGKKLLFYLQRESKVWLGLHLGMTGKLWVAPVGYEAQKHDHLVLFQRDRVLVFSDSRQFGGVELAVGEDAPAWWRELPPAILSPEFTEEHLTRFLQRHRRPAIKGVLLMQEGFPGLGNWMADEILWRAGIKPVRPAGSLSAGEREALFQAVRFVCRGAMKTVGKDFRDPPANWLFHQRWKKGGCCPATGRPLLYDRIAGRTTCWSPARQH